MTDMTKPEFAPGCYGLAMIYRDDTKECRTCPFNAQCAPVAAIRLARLREQLGVTVKEPAKRRVVTTHTPGPTGSGASLMTAVVPRKVEELLDRLAKAGFKITESLKAGVNPFEREGKKRPKFLWLTCALLLHPRLPDGVGSADLKAAFMEKLDCAEATAAAYSLQAFQALTALGVAQDNNGMLQLRRW